MPKTFSEWTVLPHDPIEKLGANLWRVQGQLGSVQRQMVLARRDDGGVVVYNAVALDEPSMKELEAWGTPRVLIVPNGYHRQDAAIWKQRYPEMTVVAPPKSAGRVRKVVTVDAVTEDAPRDASVKPFSMNGCAVESCLEVRTGDDVSLVFCDALMNVPPRGGVMGFLLAPTGRVAAPRLVRWLAIKDKPAFAAHLEQLAALPGLRRILFGHGAPVTDDAPGALRRVIAQLS